MIIDCADGSPLRRLALDLAEAALTAVDARLATLRALDELERNGVRLSECVLLAFGKASRGMAGAVVERCDVRSGIVLCDVDDRLGPLVFHRAGHPTPSPDADARGREVLALARSLGAGDTAICLVSGGGSSMLELPIDGVSLDDLRVTTRLLLDAGADIAELNAVRSRLSQLKGGRLAAAMAPASVVTIVLSDVPGRPPSIVASGPTLPLPAGPDPAQVVRRHHLRERLPSSVAAALDASAPSALVNGGTMVVAADNETARAGMVAEAARRGLWVVDAGAVLSGEAVFAGRDACRRAQAFLRGAPDVGGVVLGGETTVVVRGGGRGGRNQEVALGALPYVDGGLLMTLATDGVDGTSDAAGAIVDANAVRRMRTFGLDPAHALAENDSDAFFRALGTRIVTGPTGTNVADLCLILR